MSRQLEKDNDTKNKKEVQKPKKFKVVFHNDDYTPMDFVAILLASEFHMSAEKAIEITMLIHETGRGVAGVYSKEIAETKSTICNTIAQTAGYPLLSTIEPE